MLLKGSLALLSEEILSKFDTGDVILGGGDGKLSFLTKLTTGSDFTHVGLVLKLSNIPSLNRENIALWESYKSDVEEPCDCLTGWHGSGVQVIDLKERLKSYIGQLYWLQLKPEYGQFRRSIELLAIAENYARGRKFCSNWARLLAAAWKMPWHFHSNGYFCSEFVLTVFSVVGIIQGVDPGKVVPADFVRGLAYLFEPPVRIK